MTEVAGEPEATAQLTAVVPAVDPPTKGVRKYWKNIGPFELSSPCSSWRESAACGTSVAPLAVDSARPVARQPDAVAAMPRGKHLLQCLRLRSPRANPKSTWSAISKRGTCLSWSAFSKRVACPGKEWLAGADAEQLA